MNAVLVDQNTFNLKSTITDDWGDTHRIVLDLEALATTKNWKFGVDLPDGYRIKQVYGAKISQNNGAVYLSAEEQNKPFKKGSKAEIVLIIDEGVNGPTTPLKTQFLFADTLDSSQSSSIINAQSQITEDWQGGYKLELAINAETQANDWQIDFELPYQIDQVFGVDLINNGNNNYTLKGQNEQVNLLAGQSIKPIFIIDDSGKQALELDISQISATTPNPIADEAQLITKSEITEDWQGGYKLELAINAETQADNWQIDFDFPHKIRKFFGVDLIDNGNNNYTIKGQNEQVNLLAGQSIKPIFIIDDHGEQAVEFDIKDGSAINLAQLSVIPSITEDWQGGYKLEMELKTDAPADNWSLDFSFPHEIKKVFGVDLVNHGNDKYTIIGQNDQVNLAAGQSIKPIFIVDDSGQSATTPSFDDSINVLIPEPVSNLAPSSGNSFNIPASSAKSVGQQGKFNYGEALQQNFLFFEANRSGPLGPENRIQWRKDSTSNDGSDVGRDLNGGYFDAGDHIKFIQPMAFSSTMLAWGGVDYKEAYAQSGQLDELLEAVKWSTDWFLKAHEMDSQGKTERLWVQVGDKTDHYHWVPAEQIASKTNRPSFSIDRDRPGSDAAAGTASALASASMLFRGIDDGYADKLLRNAKALYEFAETYQGKYSDSVPQASPFYTSWSGYWDELSLGGAWLYRATGDSKYLNKAESYFRKHTSHLGDWSYATDDHSYGAVTLLAKDSRDSFFKSQAKKWLDTWTNGGGKVKYTPGGFAHRANWASVPLTLASAFAAEWYSDNVEYNQSYSDFANNQVDYILGDNPANLSYVVGFGDKYPERTHHRGSAGSAPLDGSSRVNDHILYGAVVGGPGSADDFSHNDRRNDWVTNEVGTSYNAPFAGAAIQQYENLGGDPLSDAQLDQLIGIDANGVGF